jgi:hypothetical protein
MWWLLFGGIAGFALILHGCLGMWLLRRVKALNRELDAARDRIATISGASGTSTSGVRTYDQA